MNISAWKSALVLLAAAAGLVVVGIVLQLTQSACADEGLCRGVVDLFDLNGEGTLPAWFSAVLWFIASLLALWTAQDTHPQAVRWRRHWLGLVALFAFLSFDEAASFHELFGAALGEQFMEGQSLFYTWIPYGLLLLGVVGLTYVRFWWAQQSDVRWLLLLSAAVFTSGAVGMETIGSASEAGLFNLSDAEWTLIIGLEEALEMVGVILLIYTLLRHRSQSPDGLMLRAST